MILQHFIMFFGLVFLLKCSLITHLFHSLPESAHDFNKYLKSECIMKWNIQLCFQKKLKLPSEHRVWCRKPYFHFQKPLQTKVFAFVQKHSLRRNYGWNSLCFSCARSQASWSKHSLVALKISDVFSSLWLQHQINDMLSLFQKNNPLWSLLLR